ncbi:MAG: phosphatidylserine decarboxylase, partial [Thermoguttaceae bacterium]|nr:phosphatidylserine decarboxylase [Thermoguttaceae bacterium]
CWTVLETENFGPVVQIEVGAVAVGGIVNDVEKSAVQRGREMGRFELCGSTIVQLFKKDAVALLPRITAELTPDTEVQVKVGEWIGLAQSPKTPQ